MGKIFIIAEAGVNHNGSVKTAKKMIDAAAAAKADAVKFQTFKAERVVSESAPKAAYQKQTTPVEESQLDMVRKFELGLSAHRQIVAYCRKKRIMFLSSPFDSESIDTLNMLGVKMFKVPSSELTNLPYLKRMGRLKKKIILSSGMASLGEIESALNILIKAGTPKENITVLQCNSEYPTPLKDANLLAMLTIKDAFKVNVGYSDHTLGIEVPVAAAALGAAVIEKHFTLDRNMPGPDHRASLEPGQLKEMVGLIRNIEKALGSGVKMPSSSELKNMPIARKSIIAARPIKKGETFTEKNITVKRPGTGISPMEFGRILGRPAKREFGPDELIEL